MNLQTGARSNRIVLGLVALVAAGLEIYAQTRAFAWDEGFHLVTAQSINRGKRPYLDFCFPQTPLNAYWNAGWMRVFGDTWRTPHAVAAVMTALAVLLTAGYVLRRFPEPGWRLGAAAGGGSSLHATAPSSRHCSGWRAAKRRRRSATSGYTWSASFPLPATSKSRLPPTSTAACSTWASVSVRCSVAIRR